LNDWTAPRSGIRIIMNSRRSHLNNWSRPLGHTIDLLSGSRIGTGLYYTRRRGGTLRTSTQYEGNRHKNTYSYEHGHTFINFSGTFGLGGCLMMGESPTSLLILQC
jgi:hypothetical protein